MSETTTVTTSPVRQQAATPSAAPQSASGGSAVQLKSSLHGLDFAAQSAMLAPRDPAPGSAVQNKAVQLKTASSGGALQAAQEKLNQLGFDCGTPDGVMGAKTRAAITAFQTSKGLEADGVCGDATLAALDAAAGGGDASQVSPPPGGTVAPGSTQSGGGSGGNPTTDAAQDATSTTPTEKATTETTTTETTPTATDEQGAGAKPAYLSQRDNDSQYGSGDVQCSPTSFAMQLINVYKGDAEGVKTRARAILDERGEKSDYDQVEDLLIEILQTTNWKTATAEKPSFFWDAKNWATWAANQYKGIYYKDPNAQQYVASLFDGVTNTKSNTYSARYTFKDWAPVIDALSKGAAVTGEGAFTDAGHVVSIIAADASGITINDPYGLYVESGYYLRNGEKPRSNLEASGMTVLKRRAALRSDVLPAYEKIEALPNWGESNVYTWTEVAKVQIGKWLSVLGGA